MVGGTEGRPAVGGEADAALAPDPTPLGVLGDRRGEPPRRRVHHRAETVLRGDANQDGSVNALDLGQLKSWLNRNATNNQGSGTTAYSVFADLNADGQINALDLERVLNSRDDLAVQLGWQGSLTRAT
jgi:hypothetical protein